MKRYAIGVKEVHYNDAVACDLRIEEHPEGDWVRLSDLRALECTCRCIEMCDRCTRIDRAASDGGVSEG